MSLQSERYSIGRAFPLIFISFFLGSVWGATTVPVLGVVGFVLASVVDLALVPGAPNASALSWHLLTAGTLVFSLYFVQKVAGRTSESENADASAIRWSRIDKIISVIGFSAGYILAWFVIRGLAIAIGNDPTF